MTSIRLDHLNRAMAVRLRVVGECREHWTDGLAEGEWALVRARAECRYLNARRDAGVYYVTNTGRQAMLACRLLASAGLLPTDIMEQ